MIRRLGFIAATLALSSGAFAQEAPTSCPPGSTPITTGRFATPSCVGSPTAGLVSQTLPYAPTTLFGSSGVTPRAQDPIFPMQERPPVADARGYAPGIAHIAATSTSLSAMPSRQVGIPDKLSADWDFIFNGGRVYPGARVEWMGGVLSRSAAGELSFSSQLGGWSGPIESFRDDLPGFLTVIGPRAASVFIERYDMAPRRR